MRTKHIFPMLAAICGQPFTMQKTGSFTPWPKHLALKNSRRPSKIGPIRYENEPNHVPPFDNKLPFILSVQPQQAPSITSSRDLEPLMPLANVHPVFHSQRPLSLHTCDYTNEALTQVLHVTLKMLESRLSGASITLAGRVKTTDSQLGKRLKLKLISSVGEKRLSDICKKPDRIHQIRYLVKQYWPDLYQSTLEDTPLNDMLGIRIIHNRENHTECYHLFNKTITSLELNGFYHFDPNTYKDYITHQKPNGYQSLHGSFTLGHTSSTKMEIQVRTRNMHYVAQYGGAEHKAYKTLSKTLLWLFKEENKNLLN